MPDGSVLAAQNHLDHFCVVTRRLDNVDAGELGSALFPGCRRVLTDQDFVEGVRVKVGVEDRIGAQNEAVRPCLVHLEVLNLAISELLLRGLSQKLSIPVDVVDGVV